jgi:hypothetical protein
MNATRRTLIASIALTIGLAGSTFASGTASAGNVEIGPHLQAVARTFVPAGVIALKTSPSKIQEM